jgi:hypothetical protein
MLYGSPHHSPHFSLLNDAEVESLTMEQQHHSLRNDGMSTSTLIHRQPFFGCQWGITNPAIRRQMNQSTEEANAVFMLNSPVRLQGNNTMGNSAPIVLSPLRVAATVGGTNFVICGDSNNNNIKVLLDELLVRTFLGGFRAGSYKSSNDLGLCLLLCPKNGLFSDFSTTKSKAFWELFNAHLL